MTDLHLLAKLPLAQRFRLLLRIYARGHDFAKGSDFFCAALGCDRRQLQYARKELERVYPVLSDNTGFWRCTDPLEYSPVISHELKNLTAARSRVDDLELCLHNYFPFYQPTLFQIDEVA